jgi:hypothetical protein
MSLALETARLDEYLASLFGEPIEIVALRSLAGRPRRVVVSRTRPAQGFGHDYPADRGVAG